MFCYVSLITCCSAKDDAVGAQVVLHGPRGVSCITWVGVDKGGFNWLLVPYQHPLPSTSHTHSTMPAIPTSYIVPFDPLGNPLGTILTAPNAITGVSSALNGVWRLLPIPTLPPSIVSWRSVIQRMICSKKSTWVTCSKMFLLLGCWLTRTFYFVGSWQTRGSVATTLSGPTV